jgi:hypothetical protein
VELWSLEEAAVWIEQQHPIHRRVTSTAVQELHEALKAGTITASGCVDAGERRAVSPGEWKDYRLALKHATFPGHHYMGSRGVRLITVLSIRSFPAGALKDQAYGSELRIPSAQSPDGEPGYHRVITDVLLLREELVHQWPATGREPSHDARLGKRARSRPSFERAFGVIKKIYPSGVPEQAVEPNAILCRRVGEKLKESGLHGVSDDTVLRAAGRRK